MPRACFMTIRVRISNDSVFLERCVGDLRSLRKRAPRAVPLGSSKDGGLEMSTGETHALSTHRFSTRERDCPLLWGQSLSRLVAKSLLYEPEWSTKAIARYSCGRCSSKGSNKNRSSRATKLWFDELSDVHMPLRKWPVPHKPDSRFTEHFGFHDVFSFLVNFQ